MNLKFDLQFFGGGGSTRQYRKRDPEPEELINLRNSLVDKFLPGVENFDTDSWNKANNIANSAIKQQQQLLSQLPNSINQNNEILNKLTNTLQTGNLPTGLTNSINSSVNTELQNSMGSMLNSLASKGVVNSSITQKGINNLSQNAANAYNQNYLNAFNSVIQGYGQGLQSAQGSTNALISAADTLGNIPSQAFENAYAGITPAYNMWKAWQNSYDGKEDYDTVVKGSSGCVTADTNVILENGKQIPISDLKDNDKILTWDFDKGILTPAPLTAFFKRKSNNDVDVIRIYFEDGSNIGVIFEHLFFDMTQGQFIAVNADNLDWVGHRFAKVNKNNEWDAVKVVDVKMNEKTNNMFAPQCKEHSNFIANGFITGNDGQLSLCNRFDFDIFTMTYDLEKKLKDLNTFGKLDFKYFKDIITENFFYANKLDELSIAIAKNLTTLDYWKKYLAKFSHCFLNEGGII